MTKQPFEVEKYNEIQRIAVRLYGTHAALVLLECDQKYKNSTDEWRVKIDTYISEISSLGGQIVGSNEILGVKYPIVINLDGKQIPYQHGLIEREKILNSVSAT